MPAKQNIYGWDGTQWVKILVNAAGKLIIDPTEILEATPTDGETAKAAQSNWSHDHAADPNAHPGAKNADLTISKDTPAVILHGTELYGGEWTIKEIVFGITSYLAIHHASMANDVYIFPKGQAEFRQVLGIVSDSSLGEASPYLILERMEAGGKHVTLTNNGTDLVIHNTGAGRVKRDAANMLDTGDMGVASGVASLNDSSLVVQKPADRLSKANFEITLNKLLKGAGAGADPTEIDVPAGMPADPTTISDVWKTFIMVYGI